MGVNEKPVKDNGGDYIYRNDREGNIVKDEFGKPIIDHDLDDIAVEFVKFAKEQKMDFWKD